MQIGSVRIDRHLTLLHLRAVGAELRTAPYPTKADDSKKIACLLEIQMRLTLSLAAPSLDLL